ncbi:MAG TPA: hypothetical protein VN442_06040 [Bryobacteraceae bacterium]|nr:hypothetical protein [Bryobacteraceae bacterium]
MSPCGRDHKVRLARHRSLAVGLAIHAALEINFRQKLETKQDLEAAAVVMIFREAWMEQRGAAYPCGRKHRRCGGARQGGSAGRRRNAVDLKTTARRPSAIPPDYAFQLATYRQLTPGASGAARLDTLVKTQFPQLVQQSYQVSEQDLHATRTLFPLVQEGIRTGLYLPNRHSMLCRRVVDAKKQWVYLGIVLRNRGAYEGEHSKSRDLMGLSCPSEKIREAKSAGIE